METPQDGEGAVASEPVENEDPWEAAEEHFAASEGEPVEIEKAVESHIEPTVEVPDYLKLDDLAIAHKYKPLVEERIKKIASDFEAKNQTAIEAVNQELGQNKEAVTSLVNIFRDIAQTPREEIAQKIAGYVEKYGQNLGVDPSTAQALRAVQQANAQETTQTVSDVTRKYRDAMVQTTNPAEFMTLWEQADLEKSQVMEQTLMGKMGQILKAYHEQFIAPDKETLKEFRTKAEQDAQTSTFNSTKSAWNQAAESLKSKHPDFEKYLPEITKLIQNKKDLSAARSALNQDSNDVESRQDFIERIYLAVSRNDHISTAKKPSQGGLPPTQKHIHTQKSGGGNWDDARKAFMDFPE